MLGARRDRLYGHRRGEQGVLDSFAKASEVNSITKERAFCKIFQRIFLTISLKTSNNENLAIL